MKQIHRSGCDIIPDCCCWMCKRLEIKQLPLRLCMHISTSLLAQELVWLERVKEIRRVDRVKDPIICMFI